MIDKDDARDKEYRAYVRAASREPPPDDESASLAAQDALTEAFGLRGYPKPKERRPRSKAATVAQAGAAQIGRHFSAREKGDPSCPV